MATRTNLSPNPACATTTTGNGTDWTSSPAGWVRQTGLTGMDRATGFGGSGPVDTITTPRFAATAGQQYVVSIQVKATGGTQNLKALINWYAGLTGAFISNSGTSVPFTITSGTTQRIEIAATAPAGAGAGYLRLIDLDAGSVSVTGVLPEQTSNTGNIYFDGDSTSPKASWAGTAGNSVSYEITALDPWAFADAGSKADVPLGPTGGDAAAWAESGSVVANATAAETIGWSDGGLIVSLGYDGRRGRVRITAFGLPATATRAVVDSRRTGSFTFAPVRGGKVAVVNGNFARQVDDYEFISGVALDYRIRAFASPEDAADILVAQAIVTQSQVLADVWVKYIASPSLNQKVTLIGWGDISRASRTALYDVKGRSDPIAVTDVHSSRRVEVQLRTATVADGEALDYALASGAPLFLHVPVTVALPSLYAALGDYSYTRPSERSAVRHWTLPLTEVAAPPPSVVPSGTTCQSILDQYATCADVLAAFATCQDLAD